ncbi:MAG: CoA transferase, partial [Candidatus Kapaibacterium sp.]
MQPVLCVVCKRFTKVNMTDTPNVTPTTTPFSGLVVVEAASVLAGPLVGQFFAELGARVVKL